MQQDQRSPIHPTAGNDVRRKKIKKNRERERRGNSTVRFRLDHGRLCTYNRTWEKRLDV